MPTPKLTATVGVDSREQKPWKITEHFTRRVTWPAGDYGVLGISGPYKIIDDKGKVIGENVDDPRDFMVERKNKGDALSAFTGNAAREMRKVALLATFHRAFYILEFTPDEILMGHYYEPSAQKTKQFFTNMRKLQIDFGIHVVYADNAATAALEFQELVRRVLRKQEKAFKRLTAAPK